MGNQRQMLKGNIEKELVTKIGAAKDVLDQLNKSLEVSKQNCFSAKEEITVATDLLQGMLIQRKNELVREVDTLHTAQVRPLQDAIKSTYITMGVLQSMLTHLESFDQSQLVNIRIPELDMSFASNEPAHITPSLECENLKEDLKQWGNVSIDGFQCCLMDIPENPGQMFERRASSVSGASVSAQQHISSANKDQEAPQKLTESRKIPVVENQEMTWSIENWLTKPNPRRMSRTVSLDDSNDEFQIISSPSEDMDFVVPFQEIDNNSCKMSEHAVTCDDIESGSSIVCIERELQTEQQQQEDFSIWLKPKKTKLQQKPTEDQEIPLYTPPEAFVINAIPSQTNTESTISSSSTEKRILEFPCLQMDKENWIRKKKPKSSPASSICSDGTNSFIQSQQQQNLFPPTYALPNPFWLKKYQMRC